MRSNICKGPESERAGVLGHSNVSDGKASTANLSVRQMTAVRKAATMKDEGELSFKDANKTFSPCKAKCRWDRPASIRRFGSGSLALAFHS